MSMIEGFHCISFKGVPNPTDMNVFQLTITLISNSIPM